MNVSVVIWDWNGTILDDLGISLDAVNYILQNRDLPPMNRDTYYDCLDTPIIKFYQKALGKDDVPFQDICFEFNTYSGLEYAKIRMTPEIYNKIE